MNRSIKQVLIVILSFGGSSTVKFVSLNNETCMARPIIFILNLREFNYYPFSTSLDKCNGICDGVDDLPAKIYVPSEIKDGNVKVLNMITRTNEAKALIKHISCDYKCKFNRLTCNSNQK